MKKQYDKSANFQRYIVGDKVWLKKKNFKLGESRKLSPRKTGPWTIRNKMNNGITFLIENDSNEEKLVVHHDRIERVIPEKTTSEKTTIEDVTHDSSSDESDTESSIIETAEIESERRYPQRTRVQRRIEGAIPWDALDHI